MITELLDDIFFCLLLSYPCKIQKKHELQCLFVPMKNTHSAGKQTDQGKWGRELETLLLNQIKRHVLFVTIIKIYFKYI